MTRQDRAVRTRLAILDAAARLFDEVGYEAAKLTDVLERAQVSKGALYFHFSSKEDLALAVLDAQVLHEVPPVPRCCRLQEVVDIGMVFAHRLSYDALMRGSVRLTLEDSAPLNRSGPYKEWLDLMVKSLQGAKEQGELLPHASVGETAMVLVGSYAGINMMARSMNAQDDLEQRVSALYRHVMPSVAVPGVLATLDMTPTRGARVVREAEELRAAREAGAPAGTADRQDPSPDR